MCLGIPGKIVSIESDDTGLRCGSVAFEGILKQVCLAFTPEAEVGQYVIVHAGFSISCLDEAEAARTLGYLAQLTEPSPD